MADAPMTAGEAEMCAKIGAATADAWLAAKNQPGAEVRIYFDTENDLIVGADVLVRMLMELPSQPLDFEKTEKTTAREQVSTVELKNGSCIRFLLKR